MTGTVPVYVSAVSPVGSQTTVMSAGNAPCTLALSHPLPLSSTMVPSPTPPSAPPFPLCAVTRACTVAVSSAVAASVTVDRDKVRVGTSDPAVEGGSRLPRRLRFGAT